MTPSPYQQAIYDAIKHGKESLVISAVAGSGKTTTIVEATKLLGELQSVLFLAFNKRIVVELAKRLPPHIEVRTLNSLGHRALTSSSRQPYWKLDNQKIFKLLDELMPRERYREAREGLVKLNGLARAVGLRAETGSLDAWDDLIEMYDIDMGSDISIDQIARISNQALKLGIDWAFTRHLIDYNDQLYLPVIWQFGFDRYDWVFVDEAQDLSPIQHEMLTSVLGSTGRLVAVGDRYQSIYGFRGAALNSMDQLRDQFDCREFPLSISYRCAQNIVKDAQRFVPDIQPHADAPLGSVTRVSELPTAMLRDTDAILCRFTAPLIATAYQLLGEEIPCKVLGRDIGAKLGKLVKKAKAETLPELVEKLATFKSNEIARLVEKHLDAKIDHVEDQFTALGIIIAKSTSIDDLLERIDRLFSDDDTRQVVLLMTIHKSKGLEFPRVFILDEPMRTRRAVNADQERNIRYVAATRAKTELIYVTRAAAD